MDSDAQLARELQKLLVEEALEDLDTTHHTLEKQVPARNVKQRTEGQDHMKGKGKAKSDDFAFCNEHSSKMKPASTANGDEWHGYAKPASRRGMFVM